MSDLQAAQKPARTKPEKPTTPVKEVVSNVKPLKPDITPATFAFRRLEVKVSYLIVLCL